MGLWWTIEYWAPAVGASLLGSGLVSAVFGAAYYMWAAMHGWRHMRLAWYSAVAAVAACGSTAGACSWANWAYRARDHSARVIVPYVISLGCDDNCLSRRGVVVNAVALSTIVLVLCLVVWHVKTRLTSGWSPDSSSA